MPKYYNAELINFWQKKKTFMKQNIKACKTK